MDLAVLNAGLFLLVIASLAPAALYVIGKIKDPFHPLLFVGTLSYFIAAHRLVVNQKTHFLLLPEDAYAAYVWVALLAVLGVYWGWRLGRSRVVKQYSLSYWQSEFQISYLLLAAMTCTMIGIVICFLIRSDQIVIASATHGMGYVADLKLLWITGAILWVQIFILCPQYRSIASLMFFASLIPPIERFLSYGQRGDTFRVAVILELFYLMRAKRPSKAVFITAAVILGLVLGTLERTRAIVNSGDAKNRFEAISKVIPSFFAQADTIPDTGGEDVFGAAAMRTVQDTGTYGYGRSLTIGLVGRFLPRKFFPDKDAWTTFHGGYDATMIQSATGLTISGGAACSGFAESFLELSWFSPIIWVGIGYLYRKLWDRALAGDLRFQGFMVGFSIAILYGISQALIVAEVNIIYVLLPLFLIYRVAHTRSEVHLLPAPA
ncbi:MAG: hypothetical protein FWD61_06220 [Phycisphaerales bacterium]|nr:hypothetical protein [Phycisphaerales bacterium]